jgi:hypothetical protein
MDSLSLLQAPTLVWLAERGVGYYPVTEQPYDDAYWQRYRQMDETQLGGKLTAHRIKFVKDVWGGIPKSMVDIGIGGGRFCREAECMGYDVNPAALRWLQDNDKSWDPEMGRVTAMTFWDSFEHIKNPAALLELCEDMVFISMPIYDNADHVLRSKHFRKDEHCWYFTESGLRWFMEQHGWALVAMDHFETFLGREDIGSFAFRRQG